MSPAAYLIARNSNIIFSSISYSKDTINKWYKKIEDNKNERVVYIHNNINLDHYIKRRKHRRSKEHGNCLKQKQPKLKGCFVLLL